MAAQKPLMLKDLLELDSESCGGGFACAPRLAGDAAATVRCLLSSEFLAGENRRLVRSRSRRALTRISAVIKLLSFYSSSSTNEGSGFLSRSFSKKLTASFWKKRGKGEEVNGNRVRVKDIMRLRSFDEEMDDRRSFDCPSPVVSSCSSSCADDYSDFVDSCTGSSERLGECVAAAEGKKDFSPSPPGSPNRSPVAVCTVTAGGHLERTAECECRSEGEKEQLSPVSVMDFPYEEEEDEDEDDEEDATSPSFRRSLAGIERTKHQLLQKIRRFESLAELEPMELDRRFASFEEEEEELSHATEPSDHVASDVDDGERDTDEWKAWALLGQLKAGSAVVGPSCENLLLDFFIERLSSDGDGADHAVPSVWRTYTRPSSSAREAEEALQAARDWVHGSGQWDRDGDETTPMETERSGRWRFFKEEELELSVDLEGFLLSSLVHELVLDLASFN